MRKNRLKDLIDIILDPTAMDHEKDDAAMDLEEFNSEKAVAALIRVSQSPTENDLFALENYGETIGSFWVKNDAFNLKTYCSLHPDAQQGVLTVLRYCRPDLIKEYDLHKDKKKEGHGK